MQLATIPAPDRSCATRDGSKIVTSGRARVYLDREAWECCRPTGVLLMRVRPFDGPPFALAFTADELEAVFG